MCTLVTRPVSKPIRIWRGKQRQRLAASKPPQRNPHAHSIISGCRRNSISDAFVPQTLRADERRDDLEANLSGHVAMPKGNLAPSDRPIHPQGKHVARVDNLSMRLLSTTSSHDQLSTFSGGNRSR